jgi:twitching motility two-component system response regulator PilG
VLHLLTHLIEPVTVSPTPALKVLLLTTATPSGEAPHFFSSRATRGKRFADDGFDALAKINDYQPDLVFCDILMPRLDLVPDLRHHQAHKFANIPVTASCPPKTVSFEVPCGRMVGSQDYLTKLLQRPTAACRRSVRRQPSRKA